MVHFTSILCLFVRSVHSKQPRRGQTFGLIEKTERFFCLGNVSIRHNEIRRRSATRGEEKLFKMDFKVGNFQIDSKRLQFSEVRGFDAAINYGNFTRYCFCLFLLWSFSSSRERLVFGVYRIVAFEWINGIFHANCEICVFFSVPIDWQINKMKLHCFRPHRTRTSTERNRWKTATANVRSMCRVKWKGKREARQEWTGNRRENFQSGTGQSYDYGHNSIFLFQFSLCHFRLFYLFLFLFLFIRELNFQKQISFLVDCRTHAVIFLYSKMIFMTPKSWWFFHSFLKRWTQLKSKYSIRLRTRVI